MGGDKRGAHSALKCDPPAGAILQRRTLFWPAADAHCDQLAPMPGYPVSWRAGPSALSKRTSPWLHGISALWSRIKLRKCSCVGSGTRSFGTLWIRGGGIIVIGAGVILDGSAAPIELHALRGAKIEIGDGAVICGGTSIEATALVRVGKRSLLGPFVKVIDNQFHPLQGDRNQRPPPDRVYIDENVVIGERSIILPGSHLEAGAQIGPRTVISRRVPAGAFIGGNPPRIVRSAVQCAGGGHD